MGVGRKIKEFLYYKNITVSELAELTGIPRTSLYSIISRDSTHISLNTLHKIAAALDVSIYDLQGASWMNKAAELNRTHKEKTQVLLDHYNKLNELGKDKVIERAEELTELKKYTDKD